MVGPLRNKYPMASQTAQPRPHLAGGATFDRVEKLCLHTTETSGWPGYPTFAPHITYDPWRHLFRQHFDLTKSATTLADPSSTAVRENRDGVIQVEIVAYCDPKLARTHGHFIDDIDDQAVRELAEFAAWLHSNGGLELDLVDEAWIPYATSSKGGAKNRLSGPEYDAFRGILGHEHVSGNDHLDPGGPPWLDRFIRYAKEAAGQTSTTTQEGFIMANAEPIDRSKRNLDQPLKPGAKGVEVWISNEADGTHDLSILTKATEGAEVYAHLDIRTADGRRAPYGSVLAYFAVKSYDPAKKVKTSLVGTTTPTAGDVVVFAGEINAIKDRSPRLRVLLDIADDAPADLVVKTVQFQGWWVKP